MCRTQFLNLTQAHLFLVFGKDSQSMRIEPSEKALWRNETNLAPIVTFHNKLVGTSDQIEAICVVELLSYVLTKSIARASW